MVVVPECGSRRAESLWSDIALATGVFLTVVDYFGLAPKLEAILDSLRIRAHLYAERVSQLLSGLYTWYIAGAVILFLIGIVMVLLSGFFFPSLTSDLGPAGAELMMLLPIIPLVALVLALVDFLQQVIFTTLSIFLRILDAPPKGTIASIGLALMAFDLYQRFFA